MSSGVLFVGVLRIRALYSGFVSDPLNFGNSCMGPGHPRPVWKPLLHATGMMSFRGCCFWNGLWNSRVGYWFLYELSLDYRPQLKAVLRVEISDCNI